MPKPKKAEKNEQQVRDGKTGKFYTKSEPEKLTPPPKKEPKDADETRPNPGQKGSDLRD